MALQKLQFKPGISKEVTRYSSEGGWYDCDKVRFRQNFPEKIGGWERISENTFLGTCRSIFTWTSLEGSIYRAIGTHLKMYVELGGVYYDITPLRDTTVPGEVTFTAVSGSGLITVNDINHGAIDGDFVTFEDAIDLGGNITAAVLNQEYQIVTVLNSDSYTIAAKDLSGNPVTANASDGGDGGPIIVGKYQVSIGLEISSAVSGWGAGNFGAGAWGSTVETSTITGARVWAAYNFGEDLVFGYEGSPLFYWTLNGGISGGEGVRAVPVSTMSGATEVPMLQDWLFISDVSRFIFVFGTNEVFSPTFDPMLIRWSNQESAVQWQPEATNQAGSIRLSRGNRIITARQARQEILVWTDVALYALQYVGPPIVWGTQLVGDNITIASPSSAIFVNGAMYWMGKNQFYVYSGQVRALPCSLLRYVFNDINFNQFKQVFAGVNNEFNEIWWFYCSESSSTVDRYVIYNYLEGTWYYGTMARTAWESQSFPFAATYESNLVQHEVGADDNATGETLPIEAYAESAPTDIGEGDRFSFMWRIFPDVTFDGSTAVAPSVTMSVQGMKKPGSGYQIPASEGGVNAREVNRISSARVEEFTDQVNIRVRGRQLVFRIESNDAGVQWQLGTPLMDVRTDGRQG